MLLRREKQECELAIGFVIRVFLATFVALPRDSLAVYSIWAGGLYVVDLVLLLEVLVWLAQQSTGMLRIPHDTA